MASFAIDAATGQIMTSAALDYEDDGQLQMSRSRLTTETARTATASTVAIAVTDVSLGGAGRRL